MNKQDQLRYSFDQFANREEIERALDCAVRNALLEHKQAGSPIATWQNGEVVWIAPEDIVIPPDPDTEADAEALAAPRRSRS